MAAEMKTMANVIAKGAKTPPRSGSPYPDRHVTFAAETEDVVASAPISPLFPPRTSPSPGRTAKGKQEKGKGKGKGKKGKGRGKSSKGKTKKGDGKNKT